MAYYQTATYMTTLHFIYTKTHIAIKNILNLDQSLSNNQLRIKCYVQMSMKKKASQICKVKKTYWLNLFGKIMLSIPHKLHSVCTKINMTHTHLLSPTEVLHRNFHRKWKQKNKNNASNHIRSHKTQTEEMRMKSNIYCVYTICTVY